MLNKYLILISFVSMISSFFSCGKSDLISIEYLVEDDFLIYKLINNSTVSFFLAENNHCSNSGTSVDCQCDLFRGKGRSNVTYYEFNHPKLLEVRSGEYFTDTIFQIKNKYSGEEYLFRVYDIDYLEGDCVNNKMSKQNSFRRFENAYSKLYTMKKVANW